jgi:bifunctional NMN adenylyltransferase/nudix hydrolase
MSKTVGVVVGRFQSPSLHSGHIALIDKALSENDGLLVLVGVYPAMPTANDPLDYETRRRSIAGSVSIQPKPFSILPIYDHPSDVEWSKSLDVLIKKSFPRFVPVLYGGRDSFISRYHGEFKTVRLNRRIAASSTKERCNIIVDPPSSDDFRAGVIYSCAKRWPQVYMCVDIAVFDPVEKSLLLGKKYAGDGWCFPGGFVDPADKSLEAAASRELGEETGYQIDIGGEKGLSYAGSTLIDDWRYKGPDRIMTSLFVAEKSFGAAGHGVKKASDDLYEMGWHPLTDKKLRSSIKPNHRPLFDLFISHRRTYEKTGRV